MKGIEPTLKTCDLDATIRFYRDLLGFQLDSVWPQEKPNFCILSRDTVRLMFYVAETPRETPPQMTGQIRLDMEGLVELYGSVREHVETEWGPEVYSYGRREVSILDCNGYSLILSETTSDRATCEVD